MTRKEKKNRTAFNRLVIEARKHITEDAHHFTIAMHGIKEKDFPSYAGVTDFTTFKVATVVTSDDRLTAPAELKLFS